MAGPWEQYQTAPAAQAPAEEGPWTAFQQSSQPTGYVGQLEQGASDVLGGIGKTLDVHSSPGGDVNAAGKWLESAGKEVAPTNFVPADLTGKNGSMSNLGLWLARQAPAAGGALGGALLASMLAPEAAAGAAATAGAAGTGWAMDAGNEAQEAAARRTGNPNATPNAADVTRGDLTAGAENAIAALPATRFLGKFAEPMAETGLAGVMNAGKRFATTVGEQGAASAAADVAHQVGQTVGTPGGTSVDLGQAGSQGLGGMATGALFGAKGLAREVLDAAKYRGITPDLRPAATQVANRVVQNAGGDPNDLQGRLMFTGGRQRAGQEAVAKTAMDIQGELGNAAKSLSTPLPVDAQNVLNAAMAGQRPNQRGYAALEQAVANDPQGPNLINLVRQAHAFDVLNESGHHIGGKFTGGVGGWFKHILTGENVAKSAMVGLGAATLEEGAGHLIAYSPQALAMAGGGAALGRMLDNVTGAQAPAGRFVRNFADASVPIRETVPQPAPQAPQAEAAPFPRPVAGGKGTLPMLPPQIQEEMAARASLAKLAPQVPSAPDVNPLALPPDITRGARSLVRGQLLAQRLREAATAPNPQSEPEPALNPMALPAGITGPARNIMRGASIAQRMRAETLGQTAANQEVQASPFIEQKLNGQPLPTPQAAKFMRQAMGSATALAKIQSDPAAMAEEAAEAKEAAAESRRQASLSTFTAKQKAKAEVMAPVLEAKAKAAQARLEAQKLKAEQQAPKPATLSKANGQTQVNEDEEFPMSSYAHMSPAEAAAVITKEEHAKGQVTYPNGYQRSTEARIKGERILMGKLAKEVPGLPVAELTARFEGRRTPADARAFRDHLKTKFPDAAEAIDRIINNDAISGLWKKK